MGRLVKAGLLVIITTAGGKHRSRGEARLPRIEPPDSQGEGDDPGALRNGKGGLRQVEGRSREGEDSRCSTTEEYIFVGHAEMAWNIPVVFRRINGTPASGSSL